MPEITYVEAIRQGILEETNQAVHFHGDRGQQRGVGRQIFGQVGRYTATTQGLAQSLATLACSLAWTPTIVEAE